MIDNDIKIIDTILVFGQGNMIKLARDSKARYILRELFINGNY